MSLHLPDIADFIAAHHYLARWAVFLLALSEAIPIVGTVVPGSTLVVAISALATASEINAWLLVVDATLGAIIGDGLSFWLGRHYHREILQRWPLNLFPEFIARSEKFFNRYGAASVFLARFTAVVRAFVPLIAGALRMPVRQFYIANVLSAVIWAPAHVFPGVLIATWATATNASTWQIVVLVFALILLGWVASRVARSYFDRGIVRWPFFRPGSSERES
jgi:membrane protein DedA with SNARE-associated domain